jgi:putative membrane protein
MAKSLWITLPLLTIITLAGCSSPPPSPPAAPPPAPPPPPLGPPTVSSDQDFINQATGMGQSEIGMGRLAHGKAASTAVRAFAERMVGNHTTANRRLAALATRLKLEVAAPPDQPPPELLTSSGPDFDKAYIGLMIKSHQDMIVLFESGANGGQDARVKHYARSVLPELRHHLHEAEAIGHRLGG